MITRFLVFYNKLTQINILITMQNAQNAPEFAIGPATCLNYDGIRENISSIHTIPASPALQQNFPDNLPEVLRSYCVSINIPSLFSHQAQALQAIHDHKNVILSTSTSSGKSLVYQLSLFQELLHDPNATALLLYPTKALANDQLKPFQGGFNYLKEHGNVLPGNAAIYDGDTPNSQRIAIRNNSSFLLTNPDMLHISILPHHTAWKRFLSNLRFIVIDEVHVYKGVFGSHFTNVIRRLLRIVEFYGGNPLFICTSATIHDPCAFVEKLIERPFTLIHEDGAAHGRKDIILYNPPLLDEELGVRKGILEEGLNITARMLQCNLQTLVFARSRRSVEIMLRRSQGLFPKDSLFGYRSGYLSTERRTIENGLKSGAYRAVVATNALELGVDIGGMDCVLLLGYPGSIASFLQQIGRAGRQKKDSLAVFIASMDPLDQFILQNPTFILDNSPEQPLINPHNPLILFNQLRCAAYELPFKPGDRYSDLLWDDLKQYLDVLCIKGDLIEKEQRYFWIGEAYPSAEISIRSISTAPFDLLVEHAGKNTKIGEVDSESVLWMAHPGAIFPGVIGAISLILAFYSFQTLPVNYAGLLLIALAIVLFIAEVKIASYGMLSVGGVISLALGSIMLFEDVGVSLRLMAPTIILVGGFFVIVSTLAFRAYRSRPKGGMEGLIGEIGLTKEPIDPEGLIFVHGEYWRAKSAEKIEPGERVEVESAEGLILKVKKAAR